MPTCAPATSHSSRADRCASCLTWRHSSFHDAASAPSSSRNSPSASASGASTQPLAWFETPELPAARNPVKVAAKLAKSESASSGSRAVAPFSLRNTSSRPISHASARDPASRSRDRRASAIHACAGESPSDQKVRVAVVVSCKADGDKLISFYVFVILRAIIDDRRGIGHPAPCSDTRKIAARRSTGAPGRARVRRGSSCEGRPCRGHELLVARSERAATPGAARLRAWSGAARGRYRRA